MFLEAKVMLHVREQGFPCPEIYEVSGDGMDIVMERITGPTMVDAGAAHPWRLGALGAQLAQLHTDLHQLHAPEWLGPAPVGEGHQIVHMDLHPLNVLMSPRGPVVIDWTNARSGDPNADVVATWILLAAGEAPGGRVKSLAVSIGRRWLLRAFLKPFNKRDLQASLREVVEWKCLDGNMSPREVLRMRSLLDAS